MKDRVQDLLTTSRINELIHKKEQEEKSKHTIIIILAVIGAIAAVAGIAFAVYKFLTPDYLDDFDDAGDYDFDDDFIEFSDESAGKPGAE